MALTDAQAKIINRDKKKKEKTKQKAASSNPSVKSGSLALGGSSQLSPLQLAKKDAATKTTTRNKVDYAKQSKASINTQKSAQANKKKQAAKSQIKSQLTLSESDAKLPSARQKGILDAKVAYEQAKTAGDKEGMAKAHQQAEKIRSRFGYSGGIAGDEKKEGPGLTEKDKVTLNKAGQQALLSALTLGNKERAEEIRKAKGFQAVDLSEQKDGEGRTIFTQTKEEQEKAGKQALAGLEASAKGFAGSLLSVSETFNQAMRNYNRDRWQGGTNGESTIVDPMLPGQRLLRESKEAAGEALEGKTGLSALLTKAGISGAQMLPGLAASFIPGVGPAVGASILGAQAAGSRMGELNEQSSDARLLSYMIGGDPKDYGEVSPQEAFTRGVISGGIEGLTERIPIGSLLKIVKGGGGANFLANIAKQAGVEATEESASTVLNYLADLAAQDPTASLTLGEVMEAAAVGAISGAGFGAGGSVLNSAINRNRQKTGLDTLLETAGVRTPETQQNAPEQMFEQPQQETPVQAETPVRGQERGETAMQQLAQRHADVMARIQAAQDSGTLDQVAYDGFVQELNAINAEEARLVQADRQEAGQVSRNFGEAESHIDNRTAADVSARNVKAFQFDHPQLHPYFAEAAQALKTDAEFSFASQRAERGTGTIVQRSEQLARAEGLGLTRQEIVAACDAIINDKGQENYAAAKKVELILDEMLSNGYVPNDGGFDSRVEANQGYIQAKQAIPGAVTGFDQYVQDNSLALELGETTEEELRAEFEAMGAMSKGGAGEFARWQAESENFHPISQEGAERSAELHGRAAVEFPQRDPQGRLTSKTVSTLANASISNNQLVRSLEEDAAAGGYSYRAYSDKEALTKAEDRIRAVGFQRAKEEWIAEVRAGKLSKDNTAMGLALINNAANSGTLEGHIDAHDLIGDYISYARTAGQALQAMNMVNRMTPTGQLYTLVKTTENLELNIKNRSGKDVDITIPPDLSQRFIEAQTQQEREEIKKEIYKDIASQIPNTWKDKADAWRYLAMLGNPRTHIRNIFGNLFFDPVRVTKNVVGTGLESVFSRDNRTKAITTRLSAEDRARQLAGKADFLEVQDTVMSGGKYNDDWSQIDEQRTIFKNPLLELARKGNTKALEEEDRFFSRRAYADSLAGYLKANGITAEEYLSEGFDPGTKEAARQYAIKEAQKATYRDLNAASELVTSLGKFKRSDKGFDKAVGYLVEGIVPFKKTPTNIAVRAFEYSPAGLVKGLADAATKVRNNDMSAAEAIDEIASGLTGTGLLVLGAALGAAGFVTGGASGDDKQDDFNELQGHQNYALEIGDTSYTIDWLAPEALPFFVGVELQKFYSGLKTGETERADWAKAAGRIMEPMLEMSMLQSLNDVINSVGSDVPLVSSVASAAMSYLGQFVPTIGGQIERTFLEDSRQQTVVDKESAVPTSVQYMLGAIGNKIPIPGVDFYQEEYVDAWGRTEPTGNMARRAFSNFLSPGYLSKLSTTDVDSELQRLYDGDYTSVFPGEFDKALEITTNEANKEKRILTASERKKAQETRGQTAMDILAGAMGSDVYRSMTDAEKAKFVERVHDYSKAVARIEAGEDPEHYDSWVDKAGEYAETTGGALADFFVAQNKKNLIDSDETKKDGQKAWEFESWVDSQENLSGDQKAYLKDNLKIWGFHAADSSKYQKGAAAGLTVDQINTASQAYSDGDSVYGNGNGSTTQGELYQAIKALGLPDKESAALYEQAKPKNWKATWYTSKRS